MIKKVAVISLITLVFLSQKVYASNDSEIRAYRAVKQAKAKIINKEIKEQKKLMDKIYLDENLSTTEKELQIENIRIKLENLYAQRENNAIKYREIKKEIKSKGRK